MRWIVMGLLFIAASNRASANEDECLEKTLKPHYLDFVGSLRELKKYDLDPVGLEILKEIKKKYPELANSPVVSKKIDEIYEIALVQQSELSKSEKDATKLDKKLSSLWAQTAAKIRNEDNNFFKRCKEAKDHEGDESDKCDELKNEVARSKCRDDAEKKGNSRLEKLVPGATYYSRFFGDLYGTFRFKYLREVILKYSIKEKDRYLKLKDQIQD